MRRQEDGGMVMVVAVAPSGRTIGLLAGAPKAAAPAPAPHQDVRAAANCSISHARKARSGMLGLRSLTSGRPFLRPQ